MSNQYIRGLSLKIDHSIFISDMYALLSIYDDSESIRKQKSKRLSDEIESLRQIPEIKADEADRIDEIFDLHGHYEFKFEYVVLSSLFITSFSLLENHLKTICEKANELNPKKVKRTDVKGEGDIDTMRKYLWLVQDVEVAASDSNSWKDILEFKAIRNAIIHHGSALNPTKQKNIQQLKGYKKIEKYDIYYLPNTIYFRLNNVKFLEDFIKLSVRYCDKLISSLLSNK